jgi:CBS domain-containing protein
VNLHKLGHLGHPSQKTGQHPTHLAVLSDETVYLSAGAADMKIREIMTTDVTTAELTSTLEEIATIMRHEDVGAVPIIDDGELAGIVTDRDIVVRCIAEGRDPGESGHSDRWIADGFSR